MSSSEQHRHSHNHSKDVTNGHSRHDDTTNKELEVDTGTLFNENFSLLSFVLIDLSLKFLQKFLNLKRH